MITAEEARALLDGAVWDDPIGLPPIAVHRARVRLEKRAPDLAQTVITLTEQLAAAEAREERVRALDERLRSDARKAAAAGQYEVAADFLLQADAISAALADPEPYDLGFLSFGPMVDAATGVQINPNFPDTFGQKVADPEAPDTGREEPA